MAMILLKNLPEGAISRLQLHNAGRRKAFQQIPPLASNLFREETVASTVSPVSSQYSVYTALDIALAR
jgi:hypothetical protein